MRQVGGSFLICASAAIWLAMVCALTQGGEPPTASSTAVSPQNPSLRQELLVRVDRDQAVRQKLVARAKKTGLELGSKEFEARADALLQELQAVDAENLQWLKDIVDRHGWPSRSLAGADGAMRPFCSHNTPTKIGRSKNRCLQLMEKAPAGEVDRVDIAYLTDRVRLAAGKGQLYGTQVEFKDGQWRPRDVDEPAKLDERRKAAGLSSIDLYLQQVRELYGTPQPSASSSR